MKYLYSSFSVSRVAFVLIVGLLSTFVSVAQADKTQKLKIAFLYQFAKYTKWPDSSHSQFTMCFLGEHSFSGLLDSFDGKMLGGKSLVFNDIANVSDGKDCQMVYISPGNSIVLPDFHGLSVLTVGDESGFIEQGGLINFVRKGTKQKFEVNGDFREISAISFSSKLLRIGIIKM